MLMPWFVLVDDLDTWKAPAEGEDFHEAVKAALRTAVDGGDEQLIALIAQAREDGLADSWAVDGEAFEQQSIEPIAGAFPEDVYIINPRERDTIIAALRLWQNRDVQNVTKGWELLDSLQDIATNLGSHDALDENEIDILIEDKINPARPIPTTPVEPSTNTGVSPTPPPTRPVCSHCGSTNVVYDANASWNPLTNNYELCSTFDHTDCIDCDSECSLVDVQFDAEAEEAERYQLPRLNVA